MKIKVIDTDGKETIYDKTMDMVTALDIRPQNCSKYVISTTKHGECRRGRYRGYMFIKMD